jgi:hypothetical protein
VGWGAMMRARMATKRTVGHMMRRLVRRGWRKLGLDFRLRVDIGIQIDEVADVLGTKMDLKK